MKIPTAIAATALVLAAGVVAIEKVDPSPTVSAWPIQTVCDNGTTVDLSGGTEEAFYAYLAAHAGSYIGICPVIPPTRPTTIPPPPSTDAPPPSTDAPPPESTDAPPPDSTDAPPPATEPAPSSTDAPPVTDAPADVCITNLDAYGTIISYTMSVSGDDCAPPDAPAAVNPADDCLITDGGLDGHTGTRRWSIQYCSDLPDTAPDDSVDAAAPAAAVIPTTTISGTLPETGTDTDLTLPIAALALAAGTALTLVARRRSPRTIG